MSTSDCEVALNSQIEHINRFSTLFIFFLGAILAILIFLFTGISAWTSQSHDSSHESSNSHFLGESEKDSSHLADDLSHMVTRDLS